MKPIVSFLALSVFIVAILSGFSEGPRSFGAGDVTGNPKGNGTCDNCHSGGSDTTFSTMEIREKSSGRVVNSYLPKNTYTITVTGNNNTLPFYGFQVTAVNSNGDYVGGFRNIPNEASPAPYYDPQFVEHNTSIPKDTSGKFTISFDWRPDSFGNVTIYGIVNAVDGDSHTTNDKPGKPMKVTLTGPVNINNLNKGNTNTIYPNPFLSIIHINLQAKSVIIIKNINGQEMYSACLNEGEHHINTSDWATGIYTLKIVNEHTPYTSVIVK